jgi:uncharacterized Zn finger protein (UPF0148 family)
MAAAPPSTDVMVTTPPSTEVNMGSNENTAEDSDRHDPEYLPLGMPLAGAAAFIEGNPKKKVKFGKALAPSSSEVQVLQSQSDVGHAAAPGIGVEPGTGSASGEKLEEPGTMMMTTNEDDDDSLVLKCQAPECGWDLCFYMDTGESYCTACGYNYEFEESEEEDGAAEVIQINDSQSQAPAEPPSQPFPPGDWVQPSEEEETQETEGYRQALEESRRGQYATLPEDYASKVIAVSDDEEGE